MRYFFILLCTRNEGTQQYLCNLSTEKLYDTRAEAIVAAHVVTSKLGRDGYTVYLTSIYKISDTGMQDVSLEE